MAFLVQMSGCPGAGKSTISRAIARATGAVVIDQDVIKTAILEGGVSWTESGPLAGRVKTAMARNFLARGHNVILDQPCLHQIVLDTGIALAHEADARYRYIECVLADFDELDRRLRGRLRLATQWCGLDLPPTPTNGAELGSGVDLFRTWMDDMKRPSHDYLRLDTSFPLEVTVAWAVAFVSELP